MLKYLLPLCIFSSQLFSSPNEEIEKHIQCWLEVVDMIPEKDHITRAYVEGRLDAYEECFCIFNITSE